jgi:hypothetical protein
MVEKIMSKKPYQRDYVVVLQYPHPDDRYMRIVNNIKAQNSSEALRKARTLAKENYAVTKKTTARDWRCLVIFGGAADPLFVAPLIEVTRNV